MFIPARKVLLFKLVIIALLKQWCTLRFQKIWAKPKT